MLAAHDFCQVSYNNLAAVELGYLANKDGRGIITYNSFAISEDGIPLSLQYQQTFLRPLEDLGKAKLRKEIPFEDKESYYWYKGITKVNEQLSNELHKIHIADREADIYNLFFCAFETYTDLLIRAKHNRKLDGGSALWDSVGQQDAAVTMELQIPDKTGNKRVPITVEVRYHNVEILRPKDSGSEYESVCMSAIELKQVSPKGGMAGRIIALETADNTKL